MGSALLLLLMQAEDAAPPNFIEEILEKSSWAALSIMAIVGLLGVASIALGIERLLYFSRTERESNEFAGKVRTLLDQGKLEEAASIAKQFSNGHLPRVVSKGIEAFLGGLGKNVDPVDLGNRAVDREVGACSEEMRHWLPIMGTTGATSPFIGLLGTVVGIIVTFQDIKAKGAGSLEVVSGGISEALIATAIGLLAAIPAVMIYNYFAGKADKITHDLASAGAEVIDTCRLHRLANRTEPYRG
jgi:biopolymer transport protein ExbB/TolQ